MEHTTEIRRVNKRGKTCALFLDGVIEVVLKFPTAAELAGFLEHIKKEGATDATGSTKTGN